MFFAPVVLICIISVIIYYLAGEDLPIGPRTLGNEVPTFYFVLQSQLIGTDCYLSSESRKEQEGGGEKTDILLIPPIAHSYVFPPSLSGHNSSSLAYASEKPSDVKHTEGITLSERG